MDPAVIALFRELADRSPLEREKYYARQRVPAAIRAEVESLLRFDGETIDAIHGRVAALAAQVVLDGREALNGAGLPEDGREAVENALPGAPGPALANGTVFGPYRVVRPLGRGGMGVVHETDEIESGRRVAIKVLHGPRQNTTERECFEREGRLAASVNHPNCVFGASEIEGHPVIAMEVMDGTLADRLKKDGRRGSAAWPTVLTARARPATGAGEAVRRRDDVAATGGRGRRR
jgi:Protein kinase domain